MRRGADNGIVRLTKPLELKVLELISQGTINISSNILVPY